MVRLRRRQVQLAEDGRDVLLDGPLGDRKVLHQRTIGMPFGHQLQHLAFAWSQSVQNGGLVPAADQLTHHLRVERGAGRCDAAHGGVELGDIGDPILELIAHTLRISRQ